MKLPNIFSFGRNKKEVKQARIRAYQAATYNRLVSDWISATTSMDAEIRTSLRTLRNRSRDLGRNNDYVKNIFTRTIPNNVIGTGIPFQAQVRMQRGGKLDPKTNDAIEQAWCDWSRKDSCHVAGMQSFQDIERTIVRCLAEGGEYVVRFIYQPFGRSKIPFALELIDADRLDENFNETLPNGNIVVMGVEKNKWLRPVAYWFLPKNPGDINIITPSIQADARIRVPASDIVHGFIMERENQTRGVPWLASAIMRIRQMQGYEEAEIIAARAAASLMGFIESPEAEPDSDGEQNGELVQDFEPGTIRHLAPGEKMNIPNVSRPGGAFDPFMRLMLRGVAAGAGASYESISRDYSQSNYSSSRLALIDDRDNWRVLQAWVIRNFHQVVFERWLDLAVLSGQIKLSGYELAPEKFQAVKWMPRGWTWVDPEKEVRAYAVAVRNGFTTLSEVVAQEGKDIEELMRQRARELELADELGLVFDSDPSKVDDKGQEQPSDVTETEVEPDAPEGEAPAQAPVAAAPAAPAPKKAAKKK